MNRRLWVFNHYASAPDRGVGTRHFDLAEASAALGWQTTIFASGFSHFSGTEERLSGLQLRRRERIGSTDFVWLRTLPYRGNDWRRAANMLTYAVLALATQQFMQRPDIIVGSTVHPFAALAAMLAARMRRVPFIYEIRDLWPQTLVDMGRIRPTGATARALYAVERRLVLGADAVVSLLPDATAYLAERGLPTHHVVHIPNGTRIDAAPGAIPPSISAILGRAHGDGHLVAAYAGVHGDINRLDVLVHAARRCIDLGVPIEVLLIGDGPEKASLRALAASVGATNVTFHDSVPKKDIRAVLSAVDILVFHLADTPVLKFGISSNKLFDYLAAGRPIVFACRSGNDPVADADAGVSVEPDDPVALTDALAQLASATADERLAIGARGRAYVGRHHDIDQLAARLVDVLNRHVR